MIFINYMTGFVLSFIILLLVMLAQAGKIQKKDILNFIGFSFLSWIMAVIGFIMLVISLMFFEDD